MSLEGLTVLVTRPQEQAQALANAIRNAGGRAVVYPLMSIEAVSDPERIAEMENRIRQLDQYQMAVFISSNAARYALPRLRDAWPVLPPGLTVLAIGPSTAHELEPLQCAVHTADTGVRSEDLLQLQQLQDVSGKKIVIFRGVGGRELLAEILRQRGAVVDYVELYRRLTPAPERQSLPQLIQDESVNAIILTSSQILDEFCQQTGMSPGSNNSDVGLIPLLVPSARVANDAVAAGFTRVINVNGATDTAMLSGLQTLALHL